MTKTIQSKLIKKHLIKWLPIAIALLLGLLLGYIFKPKSYNKYVGKIASNDGKLLADGQKVCFTDIDGDGNSEEFIYYHLSDNKQPVINQYDNTGKFQYIWYLSGQTIKQFDFINGDYNSDGKNELYVFSKNKDGIYLYGIEGNRSNQFLAEKVKVINFSKQIENNDVIIHSGGLHDLNNDGFKEVIFSVNNRFTNTSRKVIAYDIHNEVVTKSEELGLQLVGKPNIIDIDNDGKLEIFLSTLNSSNYLTNSEDKHALSAKTIVLNNDLSYRFAPIPFNSRMSVSSAFPYVSTEDTSIVCLNWSLTKDNNGLLLLLDKKGNVKRRLDIKNETFIFDQSRKNWSEIKTYSHNGFVKHYNKNLELTSSHRLGNIINQVAFIDINKNGIEELLVIKDNSIIIYTPGYNSKVTIPIPGLAIQKLHFSIKENVGNSNQLSIQNNNYHYLVNYYKHPYYWIRYLFYLFTATISLGIYLLAQFIFKNHIEKIRKIERESTYMHIDVVKNQLNPHFIFNALNSIAYSINKDDRKTAYSNLGTFSKFMRETIVSIDDYGRSLEDELKFVKYYLELEKYRFKDQFDYDFILSPEVSKSVKIPKMCIFSYVESALKQGILPKKGGGRVEIKVDTIKELFLVICISDNGLYRNLAKEKSSTNSMIVMERSIRFYNKFNTSTIIVTYKDNGTPDNPLGSEVKIKVPLDFTYLELD